MIQAHKVVVDFFHTIVLIYIAFLSLKLFQGIKFFSALKKLKQSQQIQPFKFCSLFPVISEV